VKDATYDQPMQFVTTTYAMDYAIFTCLVIQLLTFNVSALDMLSLFPYVTLLVKDATC